MRIIILFIILFNTLLISQSNIIGRVTEKGSGSPMFGVNIILYKDSLRISNPLGGTATNQNGNYKFQNLESGTIWLFASSIGYKTFSVKLNLPVNKTLEFNFSLEQTNVELDQILIEAKRDTFKNVSTIDLNPKFLETLPTISGEVDVFRALTLLPGVTTASEISSGLYIRGGSPDQTLTLVDGVVVYNPFHLGGFASTFNSDALENIRLIKGAFPAEYGGRLGSVLDITLRKGSNTKFKGILGLGTISSRVTTEGPISPNSSYIISGRKMYLDLIQKQILKSDIIPLYNFYDLNGKFDYNFSLIDKLTFSGYHGSDNLYNSETNKDAAYDINWSNTTLNLNWLHLTEDKKFTKISLNFTGYEFSTLIQDKNPNSFRNDFYSSSLIQDYSIKIDGQYLGNEQHTVKNGIEVTLHNFNLINNDFFTQSLSSDERFGTSFVSIETAAYIQDNWQITPLLSANIGTRFYYFPDARYFDIEPRVSLSYTLTDGFYIKSAFSITNQFLHLIVRNDVILPTDIWFPSTTTIKPSRGMQGVLAFESEFLDKEYILTLEGYYKKMNNLYEYSDTATFTIEVPVEGQLTSGRGEAYGVEFFINKQKGKFTGWVGYTLSWTKRFFDNINQGIMFYPRYDRRHDISLVISYSLDEFWEFGATWNYGTGQAYTMPIGQYYFPGVYSANEGGPQIFLDYDKINEYRLPAYHKLDLSASFNTKWNEKSLKFIFSIYNVYNRQNPFARYINFYEDTAQGYIAQLKQFTLFPFFPTISVVAEF